MSIDAVSTTSSTAPIAPATTNEAVLSWSARRESLNRQAHGFSGAVAATIFDVNFTDAIGARDRDDVLNAVEGWLLRMSAVRPSWSAFHRETAYRLLDEMVPRFDGTGLLRFACLIEAHMPEAIRSMPTLRKHQEHLARSYDFARIFVPARLDSLIKGLQAEARRG
jgi:hypothetical protein